MSIRTSFFPDGSTVYQAADFMRPWANLLSDGVFGSVDYAVTASSPAALSVNVAAGFAQKNIAGNGYQVYSDAAQAVPITANTSGYNRADLIVIDINTTLMTTTIKAVMGVPSSYPVSPVAQLNQLPLARVLVGNNASVINANVISDIRTKAKPPVSKIVSGTNSNIGTGGWKSYTVNFGVTYDSPPLPSIYPTTSFSSENIIITDLTPTSMTYSVYEPTTSFTYGTRWSVIGNLA